MPKVMSARRIAAGCAAAALPLSLLAFGAAPSQAVDESSLIRITVQKPSPDIYVMYVRAGENLAPFPLEEQLVAQEVDGGVRLVIDEGSPRLVTSDPLCSAGASQPSTTLVCEKAGTTYDQWYVSFRFGDVRVPVTVAWDENSRIDATYLGGRGPDKYKRGAGADRVQGGAGNDSIFGGGGDDLLYGEEGDDYVEGEDGNDGHFGGPGDNTINAEDGAFDHTVNCGGTRPSEGPYYDVDLEFTQQCRGAVPPTPPLPPVPPVDPPAPGSATSSSGGVEEPVQVTNPSPGTFRLQSASFPPLFFATPLANRLPTVPPGSSIGMRSPGSSSLQIGFRPTSLFEAIIFSEPVSLGEFIVEEDGSWLAEATIPPDVLPGDHTLQLVGTNADGEALVINIGIEVKDEEPVPARVITGTRGEGKEIRRVFVEGESTNLVGEEVTPRYKLPGQTEWQIGKARRTVAEDGTFSWKRRTGKKIRVSFISGETKSNIIVIPSRKKTLEQR